MTTYPLRGVLPDHGTRRRYWRGCRCEPCHAAAKADWDERRALQREREGWVRKHAPEADLANHRRPWSQEELAMLRQPLADRVIAERIARTRSAVRHKRDRLGILMEQRVP